MTPSQDIATQSDALPVLDADELAAIEAAQDDEFTDDDVIRVPLLKLGQALTQEVKDGLAEAGEFINTLTNEPVGDVADFIVAYYNRGRFASTDDAGTFVAGPEDLIPESWAGLVGDEFVGTPFAEHPDAEEDFRRRVREGEIEWGKGPLISTTYNFTGFVVTPEDEDADEPTPVTDRLMPVRLSLMRTNKKAADKIKTLKRAVLRTRPFWEKVIQLRSAERTFGRNTAYVVDPTAIRFTRNTTADEKALASQLASAVLGGRTVEAGDHEDEGASAAPVEQAKGALGVD